MNEKGGMFSLLVGMMAISVMALVVFSGQAAINEEESQSFIEVMGDTRAAYQNVVLVFSAAVDDAAADGVAPSSYLTPAMTAMNEGFGPIIQCNYIVVAGTTIEISCENIIEDSVSRKFSSTFTKTVTFS